MQNYLKLDQSQYSLKEPLYNTCYISVTVLKLTFLDLQGVVYMLIFHPQIPCL